MKNKAIAGEARRTFVGSAIKGIDAQKREIRAYASTNAWDRYGERFAPDAFKGGLDNYKKNPVILFAHDYSQAPIAKAVGYEFDEKGLILTMRFADSEKANEVFALYEGGFMSAFSVGFTPLELAFEERVKGSGDMGTVFVRAELLENSAVPVPANPEAVVIKGIGDKTMKLSGDLIRSLMESGLRSQPIEKAAPIEPQTSDDFHPFEKMLPDAMAHLKKAIGGMDGHIGGCSDPVSMGEPMGHVKAAAGLISAMVGSKTAPASGSVAVPASLKEAVGYLLTLGKTAAADGKVQDNAIRSMLIQAVNLCRELVLGSGAVKLDGFDLTPGADLAEEDAALLKEFEIMTEKLLSSGKATQKDIDDLRELGKFIEEKVVAAK